MSIILKLLLWNRDRDFLGKQATDRAHQVHMEKGK